jgi:hypothetical protein
LEGLIVRHNPCVYYLLFKPLKLADNPTSDLRGVVLGSQLVLCLPFVLEISL